MDIVGGRLARERALLILRAFLRQRTWREHALAERVGATDAELHAQLLGLRERLPLTERRTGGEVVWQIDRDRLVTRLVGGDRPGGAELRSELESAHRSGVVVKLRYLGEASEPMARHVSIARVIAGPPARFIGHCHATGALRSFQLANVVGVERDEAVIPHVVDPIEIERFDGAGYRPSLVSFTVRAPESDWVVRHLQEGMTFERLDDGAVSVTASTFDMTSLARYVVGLGIAATSESEELARAVRQLALGALGVTRAKTAGTPAFPEFESPSRIQELFTRHRVR